MKALCVALTEFGFKKVEELAKRAQQLHENELEYVKAHIRAWPGKYNTSIVVDLRSRVEVVSQLRDIIDKSDADLCWA